MGFKILDLSDDEIINEARRTWNETRALIRDGRLRFVPSLDKNGNVQYTPKTHVVKGAPNIPKADDHLIFFRGTGQDATDKINVNGVEMLRQDYWIKGTYLASKLKDIPIIGESTLCNSYKSKMKKQNETS